MYAVLEAANIATDNQRGINIIGHLAQKGLICHGPKEGALRNLPSDMVSFIRLGKLALEAARETLSYFAKRPAVPVGEQMTYPFEAVKTNVLGSQNACEAAIAAGLLLATACPAADDSSALGSGDATEAASTTDVSTGGADTISSSTAA